MARVLGVNSMALNAYKSEQIMIDRSLERIDNFRKDFRYLEQETKEWEKEAEEYIVKLPD